MSRESLKPEKKKTEKRRGRRRARGIHKCEVMEREAVTGGVRALSVLACGSARAGVFTQLSKNVGRKEGDEGGCEEGSYQRGLSHCVEVTPPKTCWPPQWTASVSPSPPLKGRRVSMASHSHTRVSACLAADLSTPLFDSTGLSTL